MKELYLIATNPNNSLEIRYDAIRLMQHKQNIKIPFWKFRFLNNKKLS